MGIREPADNFKDAYNWMELPLDDPERFEAWHVDRGHREVNKMIETFSLTEESTCARVLYSGHARSGKSTELYRVMSELDGDFTPVYFSADDAFDRMDLDYRDVLFGMCVALAARAGLADVEIDALVLERLADWAPQLEHEVEQLTSAELSSVVEASGGFRAWIAEFFARFKQEHVTRQQIREMLEPRGEEILESLQLMASSFRGADKPPPLLVVDDLEKADLATADRIFVRHASALSDVGCDVIYTIPVSLVDTEDMRVVKSSFADTFVLPMIAVRDKHGDADESGVARITEMITRRASAHLFHEGVLPDIVLGTGGVVGDALRVARNVCRAAASEKAQVAGKHLAEEELTELVRSYARGLDDEYYDKLAAVAREGFSPVDDKHRRLMHALAILQYEDDPYRYDVHPAVRRLLESRKFI